MRLSNSVRWMAQDVLKRAVLAWGERRGKFRVQRAALDRLAGWRLAQDAWGLHYLVDLDSYIDSHVFLFGGYERAHVEMVRQIAEARSVRTVLDIGANVGVFTLPLAALPSVEQVHAFEPDPRNRAQLQANLMMNGLDRKVTVHACALSDQEGAATLHTTSDADGSRRNAGMSSLERPGQGPSVTVPLRTLDGLLDLHDQSVLIKIDVEGHEAAVLRGAQRTLQSNHVWLLVESFADRLVETEAALASAGLRRDSAVQAADDNYAWCSP